MKFRFSVRDLLWLTLVVAMCAGWWISRPRQLNPDYRLSFDGDGKIVFIYEASTGRAWYKAASRDDREWHPKYRDNRSPLDEWRP
jgi:hypothetical protein